MTPCIPPQILDNIPQDKQSKVLLFLALSRWGLAHACSWNMHAAGTYMQLAHLHLAAGGVM